MEIILVEDAGFCFGVKRAINLSFDAAKQNKGKTNVYTLGPIIHNQKVVKKLEEEGVKAIDENNIKNVAKNGTIIIRTHGVSPKVMDKIKGLNLNIIDATCPIVEKSQKIVKSLFEDGYKIVIVGEKEHPEIKSIKGFTNDNAIVINTVEEVNNIKRMNKIGIISQTTLAFSHFKEIVSRILDKATEIKICNTICGATTKTQNKSLKLANEVDIMIVIGGKNSANTRHLAEICSNVIITYHIEDSKDIKKEWFNDKEKVGITAGASTPEWIINEVIEEIKNI